MTTKNHMGVEMRMVQHGRLSDVELRCDWSVLFVAALVAVSLGFAVLPRWHPDWSHGALLLVAVGAALLYFVSVAAQGLAQAAVGRAFTIQVSRVTLFVFGGLVHTRVDPPTPRAELTLAAVGPASSFGAGLMALWGGSLLLPAGAIGAAADGPWAVLHAAGPGATLLLWLAPVNVLLGAVNLLPGFPLDGGRVLRALLWGLTGKRITATRWSARTGQGLAAVAIATGVALALGMEVPGIGGGAVEGLSLVLLGWFLNNAARVGYQALLVREALGDVRVAEVMRSHVERVDADIRLSKLVHQYLLDSDQAVFPVVHDDDLVGFVGPDNVRELEPDDWPEITVETVMTPAPGVETLSPDDGVPEALRRLARANVDELPVVEDGRVSGMFRHRDVARWLTLHHELEEVSG